MKTTDTIKALANGRRLMILGWLKALVSISRRRSMATWSRTVSARCCWPRNWGSRQATLSEHMRVLVQAELVLPKRIKQWTFYRRDEDRIRVIKAELLADL